VSEPAFTLRPGTAGDAEFLTAMLLAAVNWAPGRAVSPGEALGHPQTAHYVAGWPRADDLAVVAQDHAGTPIGAAWLRLFPADDPGYGFVAPDVPELSIGVAEPWRGKGVGRALLREVARQAAARGFTRISLSVERANPAIALYRSEGYGTVESGPDADTMVKPLRPLAAGRDADVFAVDPQRVLRRYRRGGDVQAEVEVMAWVARHGYPVPKVYAAHGPDLVMERLYGPTMLDALAAGDLDPVAGGALLAGLHARLHTVRARLTPDGQDRVLHLDLHPGNVMLTASGPVVIDWRNADEGPPALDVALTAVIVAQVAAGAPAPAGPMVVDLAGVAGAFLAAFLAHAGHGVRPLLDRAVAMRALDPALDPALHPAEIDRLPRVRALVARHLP